MIGKKRNDEYQEDQDFGLGEDITDDDMGEKGGESEVNGDEENTENTGLKEEDENI